MNILLDCERLKYPNTGLHRFCTDFSEAMEQTISQRDLLAYYTAGSNRFRGDDARYIHHRFTDGFLKRRISGLDVFHALHQLSPFRIGDYKTRTVLTVHDLNFLYEKAGKSKINGYLKRHQRILDRADAVVAISHYTKNDLLQHLDLKGKPLSVIHNGCHVAEFGEYDSPAYRPLRRFIFAVGAVVPKKNFHTLPALLAGNDYELVIAGNLSPYVEKIKEQAKKIGVSDRLTILGGISAEDKYWYYKNCDAFAFPSIAEGFGLPPIEAMHFGKPVFLSTLTSLPEIGSDCAYYFPDFEPDTMRKVFEEGMADYEANDPSERIKAHAGSFNWSRAASEYYKIYENLI